MTRICLDPTSVRALERDGIGWGHDLDCGCLRMDGDRRRGGLLAALRRALSGRRATR